MMPTTPAEDPLYPSYSQPPDPDAPDKPDFADEEEYEEITDIETYTADDDEEDDTPVIAYRGSANDPFFGFLVAVALSVGLTPLIPANSDLRYTLAWGVLAGFGVLAWLLGSTTRIGQETPENLAWGFIFGLILGTPMLLFGGSTLTTTVHLLFRIGIAGQSIVMPVGSVLAFLVFVQPLGETLFFRGILQENRSFWLPGVLASLWSLLLFFPLLDIGAYPGVAAVIGTALVSMNILYSYVRQRNGLAAAWVCQITVNLVLMFLPFVSG